ncbi:hypothetical protein BDN70DRAFT_932122 [Pholiota conissans]|uniref:Uncharacterized protein n=1 Tax=Pholiota conissans TaxID=109636 RepID=A0A9P6D1A3_9AGAR|nr:hypothetical protein BDN70DRAFT_932122 [Pholiota conissans]
MSGHISETSDFHYIFFDKFPGCRFGIGLYRSSQIFGHVYKPTIPRSAPQKSVACRLPALAVILEPVAILGTYFYALARLSLRILSESWNGSLAGKIRSNSTITATARFSKLTGVDAGSLDFLEMVYNFHDLRKTYLNLEYRAIDQKVSLKLIENQLKEIYPHIFQGKRGPKHLFFALHVIMRDHYMARFYAKASAENSPGRIRMPTCDDAEWAPLYMERSPTPFISTKTVSNTASGSTSRAAALTSHSAVNTVAQRTIASYVELKRRDTATQTHPASHHRPVLGHVAPPSTIGISKPRVLPSSHPKPVTTTTRNAVAPSTEHSTDTKKPIQEIHAFLASCKPPMMQYLKPFMDFGCVTETHLRSVSMWLPEKRHNLVKTILKSGSGLVAEPTEMDVAILVNQLETYFLERK